MSEIELVWMCYKPGAKKFSFYGWFYHKIIYQYVFHGKGTEVSVERYMGFNRDRNAEIDRKLSRGYVPVPLNQVDDICAGLTVKLRDAIIFETLKGYYDD